MQQENKYPELENDLSRLTSAFATRSTTIGKEVIASLRCRMTLRDVAGMVLVSLERLVWQDQLAFCWAVENTVPGYVMREIRRITSITVYKRLIDRGLDPGQDFSVDAKGNILFTDRAKTTAFS
ncbi:hypothetical protein C7B65_07590 [Phormidesmis priestleyi ULC007]|uniref:Uncharacterized protein n=1 Tax=Phormidesmis priestleyi ULC007 TaxID=1920490 RepID=A0A2T1DIG6_9CYAN|nr:hypothetical protein [Phormidesmis priestleyi]PSB20300.1 hypothetical protein C7B65_07590 [Phormidesmis priestleyi ULC007]PZO50169.1 MAG: hypothetical protein DCF14_12220 [Phormidesmis priestleyi]